MTDNDQTLADVVRALNNIHIELKTLNQTLAKSPNTARPASHPRSFSSPTEQGPTYSRSGAAGRVYGKQARTDRMEKGKFSKPAKSGGGFSKKPSK
jgi:hypothetical protein